MTTGHSASLMVVDCGHGNLASVLNALSALERQAVITTDCERLREAACLIFPGQGAAPAAMRSLRETGLDQALIEALQQGVPVLGICLGMQLALERSEEGPTKCLGWVRGFSARFTPGPDARKVPQIGWNEVRHEGDPLFQGIAPGSWFYFIHSYYCLPSPETAIGWTEYGGAYCSALRAGSLVATQFHPEKSGRAGLRLLANFLVMAGC